MINPARCKTPSRGSSFFASCGFSIIELLIVLAILTMVTAFVSPALQGPLNRSRLRSAAVDVQSAWGKARSFAIREGMPMNFRCKLSGRHWRIERDGDRVEGRSPSDTQIPSGLRAENDQGTGLKEFGSRQEGHLVREGWLPEGIKFSDFRLNDLTRQRRGEDEPRMKPTEPEWSLTLKFRPDGRSNDARLRIAGANGFVIHLNIRGLTSGVTFTAPFRQEMAEDDTGRRS